MAQKLRIGVIFGGQSGEHEVSLVSARSIMGALDQDVYEIVPIGIAKNGRWIVADDPHTRLTDGEEPQYSEVYLSLDPSVRAVLPTQHFHGDPMPLDVIFPVIHGTTGEDGKLQGVFDIAKIPYVGSGVLGSALAMDKVIQKQICEYAKLPVVRYAWANEYYYTLDPSSFHDKCADLGFPLFVKPANLGSSVGITRVTTPDALADAVHAAFVYDSKVIVEEGIEPAHEIEIAALGNESVHVSVPGEIIASNEFYDYDAKYVDGASRDVIPADIPENLTNDIATFAKKAFVVCQCAGLARIDFLVHKKTHAVYLNEINTMPGFTSISMYSKLWAASGIPYHTLLDKLIELAQSRHNGMAHRRTSYSPKRNWHTPDAQQ